MVSEINNLFKFQNLYNVRHLGGLKTKDGNVLKDYKYIRGSAKGSLTAEEKEHLYNRGVRVIIDLRYDGEILKSPSPLEGYQDLKYYHVDMMGEFWQMREKGYEDLTGLYFDLLDDSQAKIKQVFDIFLNHTNEGVYYHCTAGKDRTGIITMLMLGLVNVQDEEIIQNYAESYENNKERPGYKFMKEEWKKLVLSKPEYMEKALAHLYSKYGSAEDYLRKLGYSAEEISKLQASFF